MGTERLDVRDQECSRYLRLSAARQMYDLNLSRRQAVRFSADLSTASGRWQSLKWCQEKDSHFLYSDL